MRARARSVSRSVPRGRERDGRNKNMTKRGPSRNTDMAAHSWRGVANAALALLVLHAAPAQGCVTPIDAIKSGAASCPGAPAISYVWPRVLERHTNVSVALNNVPTDCIDMELPTTPCAAHHEGIPPLFRCVFTHPATGTEILSDELWAQPVVRTYGDGTHAGIEPVLSCRLAALDAALEPVFRSASEAGDSRFDMHVGVRFRDLDLPFVGVRGGDVISLPTPPTPSES